MHPCVFDLKKNYVARHTKEQIQDKEETYLILAGESSFDHCWIQIGVSLVEVDKMLLQGWRVKLTQLFLYFRKFGT